MTSPRCWHLRNSSSFSAFDLFILWDIPKGVCNSFLFFPILCSHGLPAKLVSVNCRTDHSHSPGSYWQLQVLPLLRDLTSESHLRNHLKQVTKLLHAPSEFFIVLSLAPTLVSSFHLARFSASVEHASFFLVAIDSQNGIAKCRVSASSAAAFAISNATFHQRLDEWPSQS